MSEDTLMMTMLLDFYGELLTERQRQCFSMLYNEDLSLAEIAEIMDISRQGARDLIVRAEATLTETEKKIGVVRRYTQQRDTAEKMTAELNELMGLTGGRAGELVQSLAKGLDSLRN